MNLIEILKSLPKEYLVILALKILFGLLAVIGIITFVMMVSVSYLYLNGYSWSLIIFVAFAVWAVPLLIIAALHYFKLQVYRKDTQVLRSLASKEAISTMGIYLLNKFLRKLKRPKITKEDV